MILIAIIIGCVIGAIIGIFMPIIPYTYSGYLAIAIIAALDSVFGGIVATLNKNFDLKIFVSGFFGNAILSILLTYLGQKLNVDIYLAAIVVFVGRMFNNLSMKKHLYPVSLFTMLSAFYCIPQNEKCHNTILLFFLNFYEIVFSLLSV